jgi:hypothetical protein
MVDGFQASGRKGLVFVLWISLLQHIMLMTLPRWHGSFYTIAHSVGIWDDARIVVFMLLVLTLLDIMNFIWTMIHLLLIQALVHQRLCLCRRA